jgi:hypothetical protein
MSRGLQRNRKLATLVLPTGYDAVDVELGEVVGHFQPVDAVLRARLAVGRPGQAAAVLFDSVKEATKQGGEVFRHGYIIHGWGANVKGSACFFRGRKSLSDKDLRFCRRGQKIF